MDNLDLTVFFHTKEQASDFLVRLSSFSEAIYKTDFNLEKTLIDTLGLEKKEKFMVLLRENNIEGSSQAGLKEFVEKLQEKISKMPVLSITLAFEVKDETLRFISDWFMLNLKKQFVLDISTNPDIVAGIIINYNGKFKDYSIRPRFEKIISENLAGEVNTNTSSPNFTSKTVS